MNLLITGANRPLGTLATTHFRSAHHLRLTDYSPALVEPQPDLDYRQADLRNPAAVAPLVEGIEAVLHLDLYHLPPISGPAAEKERLDLAARGTFVLMNEARKAGVNRVILISTLDFFETYPDDYVIDESWQPEPAPNADALAPYLAEIICREFAREGGIRAVCLRFGPLGQPNGTDEADALQAIEQALVLAFTEPGYRWHSIHVADSDRFSTNVARQMLGLTLKGAN
jgi:nucleoside-diphosphate-sugar epimerase